MFANWLHAGPPILAAFLASFVEFVEALTVVLAVGATRGWRSAIVGSTAGAAALLALVIGLGSTLIRIPLDMIQLAVGALLLLFGLRWLRKAILRSAGVLPLHDEEAAYAAQTQAMQASGGASPWDRTGFLTAFNITMLEGIEVVFIVIAIGAGSADLLVPASLGAFAALLIVVLLGIGLHRPLARIPENALKFAVGILLSAFGTVWFGEGIGLVWPGADGAIAILGMGFLVAGLLAVRLCRLSAGRSGLGARVST